MKSEDFISRLEDLKSENPDDDMEIVVFDDSKRYVEPVATILHVQGVKKIVIM